MNKKNKLSRYFDNGEIERFNKISENMIWQDKFETGFMKGLNFAVIKIEAYDDYHRTVSVFMRKNGKKTLVFKRAFSIEIQSINNDLVSVYDEVG